MKKIKILISSAFSFLVVANNSFATSEVANQINSENTGKMNDIGPFVIGAILIICVLFIGYKMDKSEENMPTIKKTKKSNKYKKVVNNQEKEESKVYTEENKFDIPYESNEDDYYESDKNFDFDNFNDDTEYEEDDISLFDNDNSHESSFDDIDDDISYKFDDLDESNDLYQSDFDEIESHDDLDSTSVFDFKASNNEKTQIDYIDDLKEKNDNLDDDLLNKEDQDAESFIKEINKYKESNDSESFSDFSTKSKSKKELKEKDLFEYESEKEDEIDDGLSNNMDNDFLSQMEQNLKKDQEERIKKSKTNKKKDK